MSPSRYRLDERTAAGVLAELREAAAERLLPGVTPPRTWSSVLFDGEELADRTEPSRALLHALVELHPQLIEHLDTLPGRVLVDWLERRLEIPRLPVVPDTVVAVATADPAQVPVVIPAGTALRGGKDAFGAERRYATTETLTVLGGSLLDVRSYRTGPGAESASSWTDREAPFDPFPSGATVPHALYIASDALRFHGGDLRVKVHFTAPSGTLPAGLRWEHSTADGTAASTEVARTSASVDVVLSGECVPGPLDGDLLPFLKVSLPPGTPPTGAFTFTCTGIKVEVVQRRGVTPDAGFFNDGVVDITKEFQPFGPVGKRGDSFYLQSEEAFSKPLSYLKVRLVLLGPEEGSIHEVVWGGTQTWMGETASHYEQQYGDFVDEAHREEFTSFFQLFEEAGAAARVEWQRYDGSAWQEFTTTENVLETFDVSGMGPIGGRLTRPFDLAGIRGHLIRGFLAHGDFGWSDYQRRIARFAADAAKTDANPNPGDLVPPDPPVISAVALEYQTGQVPASKLVAVNGWSRRQVGSGRFPLFGIPLAPDAGTGRAGALAFGLLLPDTAIGASVSLFVDIAPAAACASSAETPRVGWEYWTAGSTWQALDALDGTAGMRQGGVLRFVAPEDWRLGSEDVSATDGRWVRARANLPERLGVIRAVIPDAVTAVYRSGAPDPPSDPTPATPLRPGELKGLVTPIAGIKRFTNPLAGLAGRGPELDPAYEDRAAGWVRHRNRAIQPWDYESLVAAEFPEVAAVRCLPHTAPDGSSEPGWVGLVVIPVSAEPMPYPSVNLAERIGAALRGRLPVHARPAVLCPLYVAVSIRAGALLNADVAAADARRTVSEAIDEFLHPGPGVVFGREMFASTLVRFLEQRPEIDHVTDFELVVDGAATERVTVDACRGVVASTGAHDLHLEETL